MSNLFRYETIEDAKNAIKSVVLSQDWKETLCKNKEGKNIVYYFEGNDMKKMAEMLPLGIFESQSICDNLMQNFILDNIDAIAKFIVGKGPLRSMTTEYDDVVGHVVQYVNGKEISKVPCYSLNMILCRNDKTIAGFYISDFTPVM